MSLIDYTILPRRAIGHAFTCLAVLVLGNQLESAHAQEVRTIRTTSTLTPHPLDLRPVPDAFRLHGRRTSR